MVSCSSGTKSCLLSSNNLQQQPPYMPQAFFAPSQYECQQLGSHYITPWYLMMVDIPLASGSKMVRFRGSSIHHTLRTRMLA